MTPQELKEIKARVEKAASLEEWQNTGSSANYPFYIHLKRPRPSLSNMEGEGSKKQQEQREHYLYNYNDGIFILRAKSDILKLLKELEAIE